MTPSSGRKTASVHQKHPPARIARRAWLAPRAMSCAGSGNAFNSGPWSPNSFATFIVSVLPPVGRFAQVAGYATRELSQCQAPKTSVDSARPESACGGRKPARNRPYTQPCVGVWNQTLSAHSRPHRCRHEDVRARPRDHHAARRRAGAPRRRRAVAAPGRAVPDAPGAADDHPDPAGGAPRRPAGRHARRERRRCRRRRRPSSSPPTARPATASAPRPAGCRWPISTRCAPRSSPRSSRR